MKENFTVIALILDASGSMQGVKEDTVAGCNIFIEEQRSHQEETSLMLVQFNHKITIEYSLTDIREVPPLTEHSYSPNGRTALLDALGTVTHSLGEKLLAMPEENRPSKVAIATITDGQENASTKYNANQVRKMIQHQEKKYNWDYCYLSADFDAIQQAANIAIDPGKIAFFNKSHSKRTFSALSQRTSRLRQGGTAFFSPSERKSMAGKN